MVCFQTKQDRFANHTFFYILRKRASLGRALQVPQPSSVSRIGLTCSIFFRFGGTEGATFCALTTLCKELDTFNAIDVYQGSILQNSISAKKSYIFEHKFWTDFLP
jgi:hypothetical protein